MSALRCLAAEGTTLQIDMVTDPFSFAECVTVTITAALSPMVEGKKERSSTMFASVCLPAEGAIFQLDMIIERFSTVEGGPVTIFAAIFATLQLALGLDLFSTAQRLTVTIEAALSLMIEVERKG